MNLYQLITCEEEVDPETVIETVNNALENLKPILRKALGDEHHFQLSDICTVVAHNTAGEPLGCMLHTVGRDFFTIAFSLGIVAGIEGELR